MSIIHDALKKTQTNLHTANPVTASPRPTNPNSMASPQQKSEPLISPSVKTSDAKMIVFISIVLILVGIFAAYLVNLLLSSSKSPVSQTPMVKQKNPVYKLDKGAIVLSGTMMMGDRQVALINDDIYEIGDTIQGKKIIDISLKEVQLEENGRVTTISVNQ